MSLNVPKVTTLYGPGIKVVPKDDGEVELHFVDLLELPGLAPIVKELYVIPFSADAWQRFKRNVESDGNVTPIAVVGAGQLPRI